MSDVVNNVDLDVDHNAAFAAAIDNRFGANASGMLTARLVQLAPPSLTPTAAPARPSAMPSAFVAVQPASLSQWLSRSDTLVIDIRPHAAFTNARLPHALSLSVPSTLLKRPLFSLERLAAMLPSVASRTRFLSWRSFDRILVYDADSSAIPDSSNIHGLLRKFRNESFGGQLAWIQGGFQAVWRDHRQYAYTDPPTPEVDTEDEDMDASPSLRTNHLPSAAFTAASTSLATSHKTKRPHPTSTFPASDAQSDRPAFNPFFDAIRQNVELSHGITERIPLRLPRRVRRRIDDLPFRWLQDIVRRADALPSLPVATDHMVSSDSDSDLPTRSTPLPEPDPADVDEGTEALAMQFYRIELAEQRRLMGVMEHHSKESGGVVAANMPSQQDAIFPFSITAGVEKGTKNRYRNIWPFEHARVRLHARHRRAPKPSVPVSSKPMFTSVSTPHHAPSSAPGSFHSLRTSHNLGSFRQGEGSPRSTSDTDSSDWDDYVNASFVQPLCTSRRYIATQGPLPATFTDFWTLVWEQNVHVIVMLTRQIEGAMVKCGAYWVDERFGPLRLKMLEESGEEIADAVPSRLNPFEATMASQQDTSTSNKSSESPTHSSMIRRVFELSHARYPSAGKRRIIQLQYLGWPDMNVPDDPRGVLSLVWEVQRAVEETKAEDASKLARAQPVHIVKPDFEPTSATSSDEVDECTGIAKNAMGDHAPVLLHCSAGVGRTGGFIAVDAVLDGVRREMRQRVYNIDSVPPATNASQTSVTRTLGNSNSDSSASSGPGTGSRSGSGLASGSCGELADASGSGSGSYLGSQGLRGSPEAPAAARSEDLMDVDHDNAAPLSEDNPSFEDTTGRRDAAGSIVGGTVSIPMSSGKADEVSNPAPVFAVASRSSSHLSPNADTSQPRNRDRGTECIVEESGPKANGEDVVYARGDGENGGLVVHVPFVVGDQDAPVQIGMDVDQDMRHDLSSVLVNGRSMETMVDTFTRRWAEIVQDETGVTRGVAIPMEGQGSSPGSGSDSKSEPNSNEQSPMAVGNTNDASHPVQLRAGLSAPLFPQTSVTSLVGSSSPEDSPGFDRLNQHRHHSHLFASSSATASSSSSPLTSISPGSISSHSAPNRESKEKMDIQASADFSTKGPEHSRVRTISAPPGQTRPPPPKLDLSAFSPHPATVASRNSTISGSASTSEQPSLAPAGALSSVGRHTEIFLSVKGAFITSISNTLPLGHSFTEISSPRQPYVALDALPSRAFASTSTAPQQGGFGNTPRPRSSATATGAALAPTTFGLFNYAQGQVARMQASLANSTAPSSSRVASGLSSEDESPPASRASSLPLSAQNTGTSSAQDVSAAESSHFEQRLPSKVFGPSDSSPPNSHLLAATQPPARSANVDYKDPRPLHGDHSPPPLSGFEDPICEVVQDMREQRMSLCQSLRQYVFVHSAIIEGALMVVDEELERAKGIMAARTPSTSHKDNTAINRTRLQEKDATQLPTSLPHTPPPMRPSLGNYLSSGSMSSSPSTGKRVASPTELPRKDKKGDISLSKRPSIKRKQASSEESLGY
ncbi:hypothetical protein HGRIS_014700 [Hohenbuehelia grisea]|uniref:protein-tyrosine-phosphatase n=1 Tax=Hohenbuehelia grisea TaxID=104357 RepID=A0ABR3IQG5_9AGAR